MKTDINFAKYKELKNYLINKFQADKTGEQTLYVDQTKLFKPVIESSKAIEEKLTSSQDKLVPVIRELERRSLPFRDLPQIQASTPKKEDEALYVDVDKDLLNDTNRENLQDMGLDLPSIVQKTNNFEETLGKIESQKRSIGQLLGEKSKRSESEKEMYKSQQKTLNIYKGVILGLQGAQRFVTKTGTGLCRPKRGKGRPKKFTRVERTPDGTWKDVIVYANPDDLVAKLSELHASKAAGNTGLDNVINSVLDELLRIKVITEIQYDQLHDNIFT